MGYVQLPLGWAEAALPDLIGAEGFITDGDWVETKDQDPKGEVRLTQLADIGDGVFRNRSRRFLTTKRAQELNCTYLAPDDILIARMPEPLGRACLCPQLEQPAVTAVDVCIVRTGPTGVSPGWLMHTVNAPAFRAAVSQLQSGSTRKRISKANLTKLRVPVPPSREQHRIADAIDSHLTRLDAATTSLERARANLGRFRTEVLEAAMSGRLVSTEAELARQEGRDYEPASILLKRILEERRRWWEESELLRMRVQGKTPSDGRWKANYEEPAEPEVEGLPEPPEGWCWTTVDQLAADIRYGTSAKANVDPTGVPVLRMGNILDGVLALDDLKYLPRKHPEFPGLYLEIGDLLFNRTNSAELVGKTAVFSGQCMPCSFASYLIRVRAVHGWSPAYLAIYLNSPRGRRWVTSVVSQQVGQANVNGTKLRRCVVPLPPAGEQVRLVAEVQRLLSLADEARTTIERDLHRCEQLRQSVLRKAFDGKLVDQDPTDEPASRLLDRVRAERENTRTEARARRSRTRRRRTA